MPSAATECRRRTTGQFWIVPLGGEGDRKSNSSLNPPALQAVVGLCTAVLIDWVGPVDWLVRSVNAASRAALVRYSRAGVRARARPSSYDMDWLARGRSHSARCT